MKIPSPIPNILSVIRILISFILLPIAGNTVLLFMLFILCGITDFLDGYSKKIQAGN
jgi:phosphatidylglycerophosphate synthase